MTMSYDPLAYEMPWRPNYEKNAVAGWLAASGAALAVSKSARCRRSHSIG